MSLRRAGLAVLVAACSTSSASQRGPVAQRPRLGTVKLQVASGTVLGDDQLGAGAQAGRWIFGRDVVLDEAAISAELRIAAAGSEDAPYSVDVAVEALHYATGRASSGDAGHSASATVFVALRDVQTGGIYKAARTTSEMLQQRQEDPFTATAAQRAQLVLAAIRNAFDAGLASVQRP